MKSEKVSRQRPGAPALIAAIPINLLMISHLSMEPPLFTSANFTNFLIGIIAASLCGIAAEKYVQYFSKKGSPSAFYSGIGIGSALGATIFALLTEVVKQFQQ